MPGYHQRAAPGIEVAPIGGLRVPHRSGLADAVRYALARWQALCRFLENSRIDELDINPLSTPSARLPQDVFERMPHGHPVRRTDELLPWNWSSKTVNP